MPGTAAGKRVFYKFNRSRCRKLIVVTGATKESDGPFAERFAQEDFDVVICARKSDELEKLKTDFGTVSFFKGTCPDSRYG